MDDIDGDLPGLIKSFERHLRAANRGPRTVEKYVTAATQFTRYLAAEGLPTDVAKIRRRDVESYIKQVLDRFKPGTALTRYQVCATEQRGSQLAYLERRDGKLFRSHGSQEAIPVVDSSCYRRTRLNHDY